MHISAANPTAETRRTRIQSKFITGTANSRVHHTRKPIMSNRSSRYKMPAPLRLIVTATVLLVLGACTPIVAPPTVEPTPSATFHSELVATLGNLTYSGILPDQPLKFSDGLVYYQEDGSGKPFVKLVDNLIATGDLNGDGSEDAAVLLEDFSVGSGHFTFLAAVLDVATAPTPTMALMVGDRIQVKSLAIEEGEVVANLVAQGSSDPACCPSWNVQKHFAFQDDALVESSSEEVSQVALADLNNTSWQLVDLAVLATPGDSSEAAEPVLPDAPITLHIADGQATGSAGCNNYNSALASNDDMPQSLVVGPMATTQKLCPDPIASQETTYLARLETRRVGAMSPGTWRLSIAQRATPSLSCALHGKTMMYWRSKAQPTTKARPLSCHASSRWTNALSILPQTWGLTSMLIVATSSCRSSTTLRAAAN